MSVRLLLPEDDLGLARQVAAALERAGYAVDKAVSGEDAWHLGDTEPYDAVILDLGLPVLDGLSVLRRWRKDERPLYARAHLDRARLYDNSQSQVPKFFPPVGRQSERGLDA